MKYLFGLLFVFLIGIYAAEESESNASTRVSCSAFAALKIRVVGSGRCKGVTGAQCSAVASAQDKFAEAYKTWWSEDGGCEKIKIEEAAVAIANACAAVYTKTVAKIVCTGKGGFGCGYSIADGSAYAEAMARAIAQAVVDVSAVDSDAFCVSDVEAISGAIAEAAASSQADACVQGAGAEEDFQEGFAESVAESLAEALVKATASTCDAKGAAAAQSACFGEAGGETKGDVKKKATKKAKARGRTRSVELCPPAMNKCCKKSYRKVRCACTAEACAGTWFKRRDFRGEFPRTWHKPGADKVTCQCKLPHT